MRNNTQYTSNPLLRRSNTSSFGGGQQPTPTNAPGAMQYATGGQATMRPPSVPIMNISANNPARTPAPAPIVPMSSPAPIAPAVPSIGAVMGTTPAFNQPQGTPAPFSRPGMEQGSAFIDPSFVSDRDQRAILRRQTQMFQGEIDATNQVYDQIYRQTQQQGEGRLGSNAAISGRSGLLGSDFGQARTDGIMTDNNQQLNGVLAEKQAKIGAIMGKVRTSVADELNAKRTAQKDSADALIKFNSEKASRKTNNLNKLVSSMLDQGVDLSEVTPEDIKAIQDQTGLTKSEIAAQFASEKATRASAQAKADLETRKTESEINKNNDRAFTLSEGGARYDANGNMIASRAKTFAPDSGAAALGLTPDNKRTLLGGGWAESEIATLEKGVRENGLSEVIKTEKANGASASEIAALQKAYGADQKNTQQFLSKDYFSKIFTTTQLEKSAADAGFGDLGKGVLNIKDVDTDAYLNYLDGVITQYRSAGFTDQEILKQMQ